MKATYVTNRPLIWIIPLIQIPKTLSNLFFYRRKAGQTGMGAAAHHPVEGMDAPEEYKKLYKQLGTRNNNKDVR